MKLVMELTEDEIKGLQLFIKKVKGIPMIETVYMVPFISEHTNSERVSIVSIRNNDTEYNRRIFGLATRRNIISEREKFRVVMDEFDKNFERLSFIEESDDRYSLVSGDDMSEVSEKALVSGTILYDRLGEKMKLKNLLTKRVEKFTNVLPVENVEEVNVSVVHK